MLTSLARFNASSPTSAWIRGRSASTRSTCRSPGPRRQPTKNASEADKAATQTLTIGARYRRPSPGTPNSPDNPLVFTLGDDVVLPFRAEFRTRQVLAFPAKRIERLTLALAGPRGDLRPSPNPRGGVFDWNLASESKAGGFDLSRIHAAGRRPRETQHADVHPICRSLPCRFRTGSPPAHRGVHSQRRPHQAHGAGRQYV